MDLGSKVTENPGDLPPPASLGHSSSSSLPPAGVDSPVLDPRWPSKLRWSRSCLTSSFSVSSSPVNQTAIMLPSSSVNPQSAVGPFGTMVRSSSLNCLDDLYSTDSDSLVSEESLDPVVKVNPMDLLPAIQVELPFEDKASDSISPVTSSPRGKNPCEVATASLVDSAPSVHRLVKGHGPNLYILQENMSITTDKIIVKSS